LFYAVFDKNFLNMPFLGYLIQNEYQKCHKTTRAGRCRSGPVGAGLGRSGPVGAGLGRSVPVGAGTGSPRYRPVPTGASAADRPQETLYLKQEFFALFIFKLFVLIKIFLIKTWLGQ
jgi:hypothetical protein